MAKTQTVWALFQVFDWFAGGNDLLSLHKTRDGAKGDYDIQKYELED